MCVLTCPTGIDIRDGLQMECIHCTQCMDACDFVMRRIGKPEGLIRYGSSDGFSGRARRARVRVWLYPAILVACLGVLAGGLTMRSSPEVTLLRGLGLPYTVAPDGRIVNQVRIKLANRADDARAYTLTLETPAEARLIAPINPLPLAAGRMTTTSVFVTLPREAFREGERGARFRISDARGWSESFRYRLVGPEAGGGTR
jgi:polyferredoxin